MNATERAAPSGARASLFTCVVGEPARQLEFVQTQWINDGTFVGVPGEVDR